MRVPRCRTSVGDDRHAWLELTRPIRRPKLGKTHSRNVGALYLTLMHEHAGMGAVQHICTSNMGCMNHTAAVYVTMERTGRNVLTIDANMDFSCCSAKRSFRTIQLWAMHADLEAYRCTSPAPPHLEVAAAREREKRSIAKKNFRKRRSSLMGQCPWQGDSQIQILYPQTDA